MKATKVKKSNLLRVETGFQRVGSAVESLRYYRTLNSAKKALCILKSIHNKNVSEISTYTPKDKRRTGGFIFAVYK